MLRTLADRTEATVYLADWGTATSACWTCRHMLRVAEVGSGPYEHGHARAKGKVLLAYVPEQVRQRYLETHPLAALDTLLDVVRSWPDSM